MRRLFLSTALTALTLGLAACGGKDDASVLEKGQVVATVDGQDITIHELNAELSGVAMPTGDKRKQVEIGALQSLVNRTILANIARQRGIDKTPNYVLQQHRADEALLVQMLQRDIASKITPPTIDQATKFMADNPDLFANRRIFTLDQIQFQMPSDINKLRGYEPLKTMEEVQQRVMEDGLEYRRQDSQLDSVGANPELIRQIAKLPAGEIFIIPSNGAVVANRIKSAKVEPFVGDKAQQYAMMLIQQNTVNQATEKQLAETIKKSREAVKYQKGYEPPKAPAAPAAAPASAK
jgi:peptidyl-prolyl cis-trans isomerase C